MGVPDKYDQILWFTLCFEYEKAYKGVDTYDPQFVFAYAGSANRTFFFQRNIGFTSQVTRFANM